MSNNIVYITSVILYICCLFFRKKTSFLVYQSLTAIIYLYSVSFIQTLDVTIVLYILFSVIPYIRYFKPSNGIYLIFLIYFGSLMLLSVLLNGISSAVSVFVIRLIGIVSFIYIFKNIKELELHRINNERNLAKVLFILCLGEAFIGALAFVISGGSTRLMLNYQCTVGNLSIAGILITGCYLNVCKQSRQVIGILFAAYGQ